jgi:hypothetical protein
MLRILATQEAGIRETQFEARPGKKLARPYLKEQAGDGCAQP